jgi:hypothetical protein
MDAVTEAGHWDHVDMLLRQLGAIRADASAVQSTLSATDEVHTRIEQALREAADAVHGVLDGEPTDERLLRTWEHLALAEATVAAAKAKQEVAAQAMRAAGELKRRARALMERAAEQSRRVHERKLE